MNDNADGVADEVMPDGVTKCKVLTVTMSDMRASIEHK